MMTPSTMQALAEIRLAEMHQQADRTTQARAARYARRARRQHPRYRAPSALAGLTSWARPRKPIAESR